MKEKVILLVCLAILILSPMIVHAGKCDDAGNGDDKWTLYLGETITELKGEVCQFSSSYGMWKGVDTNGNSVYFAGSYILKGGHHKGSKVFKSTPKENKQSIGW